MWKRKDLKRKARNVILKRNYWTVVIICFLVTLLTGEFGMSITGIWQKEDSILPDYAITSNKSEIIGNIEESDKDKLNKSEKLQKKIEEVNSKLNNTEKKAVNLVSKNINAKTRPQKFLFRAWDAFAMISIKQYDLGTIYIIVAIVGFLYAVIFAEPLQVSERRYFLKIKNDEDTKLDEMKEIFKKGNWSNVAKTMLLKNIYNILWFLTIIGGFIKLYEYKMIPFLLADNPNMDSKEVFEKSKELMKGNKWKTFLLDLSFLLWDILGMCTFGIVSILYVNPYKIATSAELYNTLQEK